MNKMEILYRSCYALTTLTAGGLALFALYKNPRARLNVTLAAFNFAVAFWSLQGNTYIYERDPTMALFYGRLFGYGAFLIPMLFSHFCLALLNRPLRRDPVVLGGYVITLGVGPFIFTPWFVPSTPPKLFFPHFLNAGPLYVLMTAVFAVLVCYSHWLMFRHLKEQTPVRQNQIKWVMSATIVGYGLGSMAFLLVYNIPVPPHTSLFTQVYTFMIGYAIVKHQLLDIKVAITRTGLALATYLAVLVGPIALSILGQGWLEHLLGRYWWAVPMGLTTVLASTGPLIYARLREQTEEFLRRELAEAMTDALTGVLVRRAFTREADAALADAAKQQHPCGLLMIDLDHFKQTNDTYGHPVGDAVLQEVACRLQQTLRTGDLIGRYGGEEFVLLFPKVAAPQMLSIAQRLKQIVAGTPISAGGARLTQTLSIGIAMCPKDGTDLAGLISAADHALYKAKLGGRDRIEVV